MFGFIFFYNVRRNSYYCDKISYSIFSKIIVGFIHFQ